MILLLSFVKLELYPTWFPISEKARYIVLAFHLMSDKKLKGEVEVSLSFESSGRKPFKDVFKNEIKGSKDSYILYEGAISWDSTFVSGTLKIGRTSVPFTTSIKGYKGIKTSSLVLAQKISKKYEGALFFRDSTYIRPCFTCIFYGYLNFYVEALSDSPVIVVGVINRGNESVLRLPIKTFKGDFKLSMSVPIWELGEGDYDLVVNIVSPKVGEEVTLKRHFMVSKYADNIASFIDYVATKEELKEFHRLLGIEEKINFLRKFWQKRGDEFYEEFRKRVLYADSVFSTYNRLGRYTDMGRIYIRRGKPDEINTVEVREGGKSYIKWVYYTAGGYTYYFYDPTGTGEYVLIKTDDPQEATFTSKEVIPSLKFDEGGELEY